MKRRRRKKKRSHRRRKKKKWKRTLENAYEPTEKRSAPRPNFVLAQRPVSSEIGEVQRPSVRPASSENREVHCSPVRPSVRPPARCRRRIVRSIARPSVCTSALRISIRPFSRSDLLPEKEEKRTKGKRRNRKEKINQREAGTGDKMGERSRRSNW